MQVLAPLEGGGGGGPSSTFQGSKVVSLVLVCCPSSAYLLRNGLNGGTSGPGVTTLGWSMQQSCLYLSLFC